MPHGRPLVALVVGLAVCLSGAGRADPALDLFDEAAYHLALQYGGFADPGPQELAETFRDELSRRCAELAGACPESAAETAIAELVAALGDPHTAYLPPETFARWRMATAGGGSPRRGFGLQLASLDDDRGSLVLRAFPGGAAAGAGLRRGDVIVATDDGPLPPGEQGLLRIREAEARGGPVRVTIERAPDVRFDVTVEPAPFAPLPGATSLPHGVVLLDVPSFFAIGEVGAAVHDLVREAQRQGAAAIVVDVRDDPGGFLHESLTSAAAFVEAPGRRVRSRRGTDAWTVRDGVLVIETQEGQAFPQYALEAPVRFAGEVVVLVNGATASAAEFFALDLEDGGATIVGEATFGVANTGTSVLPLSNGGGLQVTTGRILRLDGSPYPPRVTPPVAVRDDREALARGRDAILERALEHLNVAGDDRTTVILGLATRTGPARLGPRPASVDRRARPGPGPQGRRRAPATSEGRPPRPRRCRPRSARRGRRSRTGRAS